MNTLYFGNNLQVLRDSVANESVDLIYLDPPFNSKKQYSAFFKTPKGHVSESQLAAFDDTWHWGPEAEIEFQEILRQSNTDVAEMMRALRTFLGENDMMAYLTMMANRLLELHRVLKKTGSLYLHCDPTAGAYLKIVLDAVFGKLNYRNEIIWKRTSSLKTSQFEDRKFGVNTDIIFFYTKTDDYVFKSKDVKVEFSEQEIEDRYRFEDEKGRYAKSPTFRSMSMGLRPNLCYEYKGVNAPSLAGWKYSKEYLIRIDEAGDLGWSKSGVPFRKFRPEHTKGRLVSNLWDDIEMTAGGERMHYPTQKPLKLLERIILASSNEGDVVLDPFCGCGTAVHAAQRLNREWMGIDITSLAISLVENRLRDAFPTLGKFFEVEGTPTKIDEARDLALRDKYQFQWWACSLVNAQPYQGKKKGSDGGIDGLIFFQSDLTETKKIVVSVKGGENVGVTMVKDLIATIARENATIGLFVTLAEPTKPMITEAASAGFFELQVGKDNPKLYYPKIQILTIEGLLNGSERPDIPEFGRGVTFKKAPVEKKTPGKQVKLL